MFETWFRIVFWLRVSRLANRSRRSRETPAERQALEKGCHRPPPLGPGGAPSGVSPFRQTATPLHFEVDRLLVVATGASAGVWSWSGE